MAHKKQMYENLRDMLEREVGEIERKRELTKDSLDNLFKLTASLKVVDKCIEREEMQEAMKEGGMSMDGRNSYGYSYMMRPPYWNYSMTDMSNGGGYMGNSGMSRNSYDMSGNMSNAIPGDGMSMDGMSGARRGRDGDNDGRYNESRDGRESRDNFRNSQDRGRSYADGASYGYSRDASRKKMVQKLETLMDDTMSENERKAIQDCIERIDNK